MTAIKEKENKIRINYFHNWWAIQCSREKDTHWGHLPMEYAHIVLDFPCDTHISGAIFLDYYKHFVNASEISKVLKNFYYKNKEE